jgi:3-deoxy-D-manno-octulosonic acid (KDO) 8-phosphate synthase
VSNIDRKWHWRGQTLGQQKSQFGEEIFDIHEARKCQAGAEVDDWITTERELTRQGHTEKQNTRAAKVGRILEHGASGLLAMSL